MRFLGILDPGSGYPPPFMHRFIGKILATLFLSSTPWTTGCAKTSMEIGIVTRAEAYVELDDRLGLLCGTRASCAVLPAIMSGISPGQSITADFAFDDALNRDIRAISPNPTAIERPLNVLRHHQVVQTCISNDRLKLLRELLSSTQPGNIVDPKLLRELGQMLNVEYVFLPQIVYVATDNATRFSFAGFTFILTGWISIEGTLQLWHTETGVLAWQSVAEASLSSENLSGVSPPTQDAMNALFIAVMDGFLAAERETVVRGQVEPPPATTPRSAEAADANAIRAVETDSQTVSDSSATAASAAQPKKDTPDAAATAVDSPNAASPGPPEAETRSDS